MLTRLIEARQLTKLNVNQTFKAVDEVSEMSRKRNGMSQSEDEMGVSETR